MKKYILVVLSIALIAGSMCGCGKAENNEVTKGTDTSTVSTEQTNSTKDTSASAESGDNSASTENSDGLVAENLDDPTLNITVSEDIKKQKSYQKLAAVSNGDIIEITNGNNTAIYGLTESGEILTVDKGIEEGTEYTYVKYTDGLKMYITDVGNKQYVVQEFPDSEKDAKEIKEGAMSEIANYMFSSLTFKECKDGVEIYSITTADSVETIEEPAETDEANEAEGSESNEAEGSEANEAEGSESNEAEGSESNEAEGSTATISTNEAVSDAESSVSEYDADGNLLNRREIAVNDKGFVIVDYLNGEKVNNITVIIRKITSEDKKLMTIEGYSLYEAPETVLPEAADGSAIEGASSSVEGASSSAEGASSSAEGADVASLDSTANATEGS